MLFAAAALWISCEDLSKGELDGGTSEGGVRDARGEDGSPSDSATLDCGADAAPDAGPDSSSDAAVACQVSGQAGLCMDVDLCDGISTPGYCPGPANIQCCTAYPFGCDPEACPLPNLGLTEPAGVGTCPQGMVPVDTFCMDRFEASLMEVHADLSTSHFSPYCNPGNRRVRAVSLPGAVPQAYVSGTQAALACAEAGKRLCTDAEWLRGCQGALGWTYPYGNTRQPGTCNDARDQHPAIQYFGTSDSWIWSELGHPCLNQLPDSLALTGSHPGCVTAEGVFDLMGNLHEWTSAPTGTFRGGYYVDTVINGEGCLYRTTAHSMSHWDYSTGFRCCAD